MPRRAGSRSHAARRGPAIHPGAWVVWLLATVAALLSTRNPVYLAVILLCIAATLRAGRALAFSPQFPLSLWRFGLIVITLSAAFNGLMSHFGQTVLFTLPASIPLIGGAVTLEAVVYGALNGLVLTAMFAAFLALYQATPTYALNANVTGGQFVELIVTDGGDDNGNDHADWANAGAPAVFVNASGYESAARPPSSCTSARPANM